MSELVFSFHFRSFVRSFWHLLLLPPSRCRTSSFIHLATIKMGRLITWATKHRRTHYAFKWRNSADACALCCHWVTHRIVWCSPCFCGAAIFFKFALLIFGIWPFFRILRTVDGEIASTASFAIPGRESFDFRTCWHFQLAQSWFDSIDIRPHTSIDLHWQRQTIIYIELISLHQAIENCVQVNGIHGRRTEMYLCPFWAMAIGSPPGAFFPFAGEITFERRSCA